MDVSVRLGIYSDEKEYSKKITMMLKSDTKQLS